jgi:hypothetical protein
MKGHRLTTFVALTLLAACARDISFDVAYNIKEVSPNAKVRATIDPALLQLKENSTERRFLVGPRKGSYDIGKALRYYFENDRSSPVAISYVGSSLHWHRIQETRKSGFDAEYRISVVVQAENGSRQAVIAKGNGRSLLSSVNACQEAIENAVMVLYRESAALSGLQLKPE